MRRNTGYPVAGGDERWRFYTGAPIRHAPFAGDTHVYFDSDDGYLYCLNMKGELAWKLRGGPTDRLVIGHERIMSAWPISTQPLLQNGEVPTARSFGKPPRPLTIRRTSCWAN